MTPAEKNIVKSLIVLAWADGKVEGPERSVIEGLLCGFDASDEDEQELLAYAAQPRRLDRDLPLQDLTRADRELLLSNAALLTFADGQQDESERRLLQQLVTILGISDDEADKIIRSAKTGARPTGDR